MNFRDFAIETMLATWGNPKATTTELPMAKTYDSKSYELAEHFLQDETGLWTDENTDALAKVIQQAVEDEVERMRDNYDPTPYCSYGHKSAATCDCGPIADNE